MGFFDNIFDPGGRTANYNKTREAEGRYDAAEENFTQMLNQLQDRLAPWLSGKLQPGELEAAEQLKGQQNVNLNRTLGNYGITGGDGVNSVPARASLDIENSINDQMLSLAEGRKFEAEQILANAEMQRSQGLAPFEQQIEQSKRALDASQSNLTPEAMMLLSMFMPGAAGVDFAGQANTGLAALGSRGMTGLTSLAAGPEASMAGLIGGVGNMMDGNPFEGGVPGSINVNELLQNQAIQQTLGNLGIDPAIFNQGTPANIVESGGEFYNVGSGETKNKLGGTKYGTPSIQKLTNKAPKEDTQVKTNYQNGLSTISTTKNQKEAEKTSQSLINYLSSQGSLTTARLTSIENAIEKRGKKASIVVQGVKYTYDPKTKEWD